MKLFWKLFCSMVLLTLLICSLGSYILIDTYFRTSLEREVTAVYEENDLLRYTLNRELQVRSFFFKEDLSNLADSISITTKQSVVVFRISEENGETITAKGTLPVDALSLTSHLQEDMRGYHLVSTADGRIFLHAASPLLVDDTILFLENCREVSDLFSTRSEQYQIFFYLMLALTAAVGAASLLISALILRPLGNMSFVTRKIADGELHMRVEVKSHDELGLLAEDFNIMAEKLEMQVQELIYAARRQEDFIGSFTHEIKTPLTSIIGYADLLRSRPATAEQVRDSADYIFREGRRLEALSRKLMDLIVLEQQDFPLRAVPIDTFLQRIGKTMLPVLEKQGICLKIQAEKAVLSIEPDLLETVCLNLLDNARKAMDNGGAITFEGICEESGYCVQVTDNGKGIPIKELSRITEAFYMVDKSRSRSQGGAGLGLAICQRIVELHNGTMEFQSVESIGTRVSIHLKGGEAG